MPENVVNNQITILQGDCFVKLGTLPDQSIHCCVTSPPYWGLRDYGVDGQIGLEKTPEEYVAKMVSVFREVKRVLRDDGTLWLNLGDSYAANGPRSNNNGSGASTMGWPSQSKETLNKDVGMELPAVDHGLKPKDLVGIPWRVAFALQADGWYLRSDIIWHKPNPMPESVTDRPTKSHEYIFLLSKQSRYYYDAEAVKEPNSDGAIERFRKDPQISVENRKHVSDLSYQHNRAAKAKDFDQSIPGGRNKRSVWTVPSQPYPESHFATFPEALIKPCILAGTSAKGCCPLCGAPWERVVEKSGGTWEDRKSNGSPMRYGTDHVDELKTTRLGESASQTIGWQPGCDCGHGTLQPCTVLDPFGGSGTTGQVALELGRKAILIELNPEYVKLINQRTDVTPGLALA